MKKILTILALGVSFSALHAAEPVDIGTRRELFLDDFWIESSNNAQILVHQPVRKEIVVDWNKPWEGSGSGYTVVMKDRDEKGPIFRMYYKAWHHDMKVTQPLVIAYQESRDGIRWERPDLGFCEHRGSKENNILIERAGTGRMEDFNVFLDENPRAMPEARYKAIGLSYKGGGLWAFQSSDAVHWTPMKDGPVYAHAQPAGYWMYDSQNVAHWSEKDGKYVLYHRTFDNEVRNVRRAVSDDFLHWIDEGVIRFPEGEGPRKGAEYYVNQILPYYRAPHLLIGFPARYVDPGWVRSTEFLPERELRKQRAESPLHGLRVATTLTDSVYIVSRNGIDFRQSNDVFLAPGLRTKDNWTYGDNYIAWHVVETEPTESDTPTELSIYATESYMTGDSARLRRFTLRIDGFASLHAKSRTGEVVTRPLIFGGDRLSLNMGTGAAGEIRVELLDAEGKPVPGRTAVDCDPIFGDSLDRTVSWKGEENLSTLTGKAVRLRFILREADIYSFVFEKQVTDDT